MQNKPLTPTDIKNVVTLSLNEDIGTGDITAKLIPETKILSAHIISREPGILCGRPWAEEIFKQIDDSVELNWSKNDGDSIAQGENILQLSGSARSILTAERTVLNFLQTLSAVATLSHYYSSLVRHTSVKLLDTRKTLPCLRTAQKYAVTTGGCFNHRIGLYDAFLIKENHITACGGIEASISKARSLHPEKPVEVEVRSLHELEQAIACSADIIMLDNFNIADTEKAVNLNKGRSKLEASGGIEKDMLIKFAETGVDYISIGALTKNCQAIDLSLLVD
jgi:nicotinate-nucleotide pyrophosphorylase (carboxylating)